MLTIWGRQSSSNVQAVLWCVAELELPFERIDAGFTYGVVNSPDYLAMNPNGTVPTIQDGDQAPLWESGAVMRYLSTRYGGGSFWPDEPAERANIDRWAEWAKINVALNFTSPIFWQVVRTPKDRQNPEAIEMAVRRLDKYLAIADEQLAKFEYLAGDEFTLADIQFGHCLFRYFDIDLNRSEWPRLKRYYDLLGHRAAFVEHVMIDYSELENSM